MRIGTWNSQPGVEANWSVIIDLDADALALPQQREFHQWEDSRLELTPSNEVVKERAG